jgi:hypothetical protein
VHLRTRTHVLYNIDDPPAQSQSVLPELSPVLDPVANVLYISYLYMVARVVFV